MPDRPYDVVIFGATGFAGRLVARYLAQRTPEPGVRWAVAGRDRSKLQALVEELGLPELPIVVADSNDPQSLEAMAAASRVICTTVGPYARYGAPLVAAAVKHRTHTCDLTGEPQFVRRMIDAHHDEAHDSGVRIVSCCGFDSIPSDLGVWVLQSAAIERLGAPCSEVELVVAAARGGFSGGTLASMATLLDEARDPAVRRVLGDPYSLAPGAPRGPDGRSQTGVRYSEAAGAWTAPFVMASINERVVRRSHALLGQPWGQGFRYHESMRTRAGLRGRLGAGAVSVGLGLFTVSMATPLARRVLQRTVLPAPGEGPSEEAIESGFFKIHLYGRLPDDPEPRIEVVVRGRRDPGYGATACMLAESALCLASDPLPERAGVLTPSTAMGDALVARLNATDVQFEVLPAPSGA